MNAEIIRSYEHNSTFIGNAVLRSGLSLKAKGLLCTMLSLPKSWHFSVQGLSKICGEGKDSIRTAINELKARGFLQIKQLRGDGGKITGTHWVISDTPIEPEVENPNMAEKDPQPEAEVPNVEKTPQYKKGMRVRKKLFQNLLMAIRPKSKSVRKSVHRTYKLYKVSFASTVEVTKK